MRSVTAPSPSPLLPSPSPKNMASNPSSSAKNMDSSTTSPNVIRNLVLVLMLLFYILVTYGTQFCFQTILCASSSTFPARPDHPRLQLGGQDTEPYVQGQS